MNKDQKRVIKPGNGQQKPTKIWDSYQSGTDWDGGRGKAHDPSLPTVTRRKQPVGCNEVFVCVSLFSAASGLHSQLTQPSPDLSLGPSFRCYGLSWRDGASEAGTLKISCIFH